MKEKIAELLELIDKKELSEAELETMKELIELVKISEFYYFIGELILAVTGIVVVYILYRWSLR